MGWDGSGMGWVGSVKISEEMEWKQYSLNEFHIVSVICNEIAQWFIILYGLFEKYPFHKGCFIQFELLFGKLVNGNLINFTFTDSIGGQKGADEWMNENNLILLMVICRII